MMVAYFIAILISKCLDQWSEVMILSLDNHRDLQIQLLGCKPLIHIYWS